MYVLPVDGAYAAGEIGHRLKACCYLQPNIQGWAGHHNWLQVLPDQVARVPYDSGDGGFAETKLEVQRCITFPCCKISQGDEQTFPRSDRTTHHSAFPQEMWAEDL